MSDITNDRLCGVNQPWKSDPIKFVNNPSFEVVRSATPGYYIYSVDGIVSSEQVDAVQLVEWKMAELLPNELFTPSAGGPEFTGVESVVRDFIDGGKGYLVERGGCIMLVNDYYLVAEKLAVPTEAMKNEGRAAVARAYEPLDKPWVFDEIRFTLPLGVKVKKATARGKYIVDKNLSYTMIYSASRLVSEGLAKKDENMYDGYFSGKATSVKWSDKKAGAFFSLVCSFAKKQLGYSETEKPSSLYEAALLYVRAVDAAGGKTGKTFGAWINGIYDTVAAAEKEKADRVKDEKTVINKVVKDLNSVVADIAKMDESEKKIVQASARNGAFEYSLFFAFAMKKKQYGSDKSESKVCVELFGGEWLDKGYKIAKSINKKISQLNSDLASANEMILNIERRKLSDVLVEKKDSATDIADCSAFLEKLVVRETEESDVNSYKQSIALVKNELDKTAGVDKRAEWLAGMCELLSEKEKQYAEVYKKATMRKMKKPCMLFAKKINKPYPKNSRCEYFSSKKYYRFSLQFINNKYRISRCDDKEIILGGVRFALSPCSCYRVYDKKSRKDLGIFSEEGLVYCGLARWK